MTADWLNAWATVVAALAAIAGVAIAYWQLSNLNKTLRMNALTIVLQLESEMNARKQRLEEYAAQLRIEACGEKPNDKLIEILSDELNGYLENWLNSSDRLAFCILKGYLEERDWKTDYRQYFADMVRSHEDSFGPSSIYTNVIDLNNKWKRE